MPSISISNDWVPSMVNRMTANSSNGNVSVPSSASQAGLLHCGRGYSGNSVGQILVMKGTVPSDFTTLASINSRAADILIRYSTQFNSLADFVTSQVTVNPANISTQYRAAQASGTATWLWWVVIPTLPSGEPNDASGLLHQVIGTVGLPLSGADLEIPTTNIATGEQYRIVNLRVQFPTSWNY